METKFRDYKSFGEAWESQGNESQEPSAEPLLSPRPASERSVMGHEVNAVKFADVWLLLLVWSNGGEITIPATRLEVFQWVQGTKIVTRQLNPDRSVTLRVADCPIHNTKETAPSVAGELN